MACSMNTNCTDPQPVGCAWRTRCACA